MHRFEENRYLPVFALLALVITIQSFLIGEDRKQSDFDRPVITQHTPFVAPRAMPSAPRDPQLARAGESTPPDVNGPPVADAGEDAGWVHYQAGQTAPEDDADEPGMSPPPSAAPSAASADDTAPLAEEASPDDQDAGAQAPKDDWVRPVPLHDIIQEATAPRASPPPSATRPLAPVPASGATSGTSRTGNAASAATRVTTCEVDIGDNLWKIAKRFHVTGEEILRANKLQSGVLLPGQVLVIPSTPQIAIPPGFDVVHVRDGETAIDVANRVGVPLIDLVRENDLASLYQISPGTVLRYKKPGAAPVTHATETAKVVSPARSGLSYPVSGRLGSRFGWRKHPILGETLFHTGVDLCAPRGEPIRAAQDGRVIYAGWLRGYGQTLVVRHAGGYTTRYGHCSALLKKVGDKVKRCERIAKVGSSGRSTGPHVHFEVRLMGKPLNPLKFLRRGGARS